MTNISDLQAIGVGAPPQQITGTSSQDTFLTLMLAQLQNQDPMQPLENGEFLSQLAAFETAAGVSSLEQSFLGFASSMYTNQALQAADLLGHSVLAAGNKGFLPEGGTLDGAVNVPAGATSVVVEISDESGQLVASLELGQQAAGRAEFSWDGLDAEGNPLPSGSYTLSAQAMIDGEAQSASTLIASEVTSVSLDSYSGSILLNLASGDQVPFGEVSEII